MAKTPNEQEQNAIDNIDTKLVSLSDRAAKNKKLFYWTLGILVAIGACWGGWLYYNNDRNDKAVKAYNAADEKVMNATLDGDSIAAIEFGKVADQFSGTDAGNVAALQAAQAYYRLGKYNETVKYLDMFSTDEEVMSAQADLLLGDAYVNLKKYDDALKAFDSAAKKGNGNDQIMPVALWKEANVYDAQKKYQDALNCYQQIKTAFPTYMFGNGMTPDAYIAREQGRLGK